MKAFLGKFILPSLFFMPYLSQSQALPQPCESKLVPYQGWKESPDTQWQVTLKGPNGGSLRYIGAVHSTDPSHGQFSQIKQAWSTQKPTLVFFEGPDRGTRASEAETIAQLGESGYVRFLAQKDGIKTQSLEMSPQEEVDYLMKTGTFSQEQIKLFFLLREASRLRERKVLKEEQIKAAMAQLLPRAHALIKGFDQIIPDVASIQVAYQKHWTQPANWWEAPSAWFDPLGNGQKTGGKFTNEINRLSSENRNLHMYRLLSSAVLKGEKVLAVVGRNHVPMQAEALKCALAQEATN